MGMMPETTIRILKLSGHTCSGTKEMLTPEKCWYQKGSGTRKVMLIAYRDHSGVNRSPFRASQMVRGTPECSRIYAFDSQQRSYFTCADSKAKMGPIQKAT